MPRPKRNANDDTGKNPSKRQAPCNEEKKEEKQEDKLEENKEENKEENEDDSEKEQANDNTALATTSDFTKEDHCILVTKPSFGTYFINKEQARIAAQIFDPCLISGYHCFGSKEEALAFMDSLKNMPQKETVTVSPTRARIGKKFILPTLNTMDHKAVGNITTTRAFVPPVIRTDSSNAEYLEFKKNNPVLQQRLQRVTDQGSIGWEVYRITYNGDDTYITDKQVVVFHLVDRAKNRNQYWCHKPEKWIKVFDCLVHQKDQILNIDDSVFKLCWFPIRDMDKVNLIDKKEKKNQVQNRGNPYYVPVTAFRLILPKAMSEAEVTELLHSLNATMVSPIFRGSYAEIMEGSSEALRKECDAETGKYWTVMESLVTSDIRFIALESLDEIFLDEEIYKIMTELFQMEIVKWPDSLAEFAFKYTIRISEN